MKRIFAILVAVSCLCVCAFAQAKQNFTWSGSAYYDFHARKASAVVLNRLGELTLKGKPTGIEVNGFVGLQNAQGTPGTVGGALLWHRQIFDQVGLEFGFGGGLTGGKWSGGIFFGASISLGS